MLKYWKINSIMNIAFLCIILSSLINYQLLSDENSKNDFSIKIIQMYESGNSEGLKNLIQPYRQETPAFGSLLGSVNGDKYYKIGAILGDFYANNDWAAIMFFLDNGASGFIEDGKIPIVKSFLAKAIRENNTELLESLIKAGASFNVGSELGNVTSDLDYAIKNKSYECLRKLLELGADPNYKTKTKFIGEPGFRETYSIFNALNDPDALTILLHFGARTDVEKIVVRPEKIDGVYKTATYRTVLQVHKNGLRPVETVKYSQASTVQ